MTPPLAGIRVLDLTRLIPGGICTLMMADLGADVIKIESPDGGDYLRATPPLIEGNGVYFHTINRNKRSATLDLKAEAGREALHRLARSADVLIEGFRPGVMARLGCDYPVLKALNSRLIFCSLSGWGQTGAYAALTGHDLSYIALSGMIGEMSSAQPLGGQVADVGGAYVAFGGIAAALYRREKTGEGAYLDLSLFESALPFASYAWVEALMQERHGDSVPRGMLSGRYACYNVYRTRDGQPVALAAYEQRFWANFCRVADREDLIDFHDKAERQRYLLAEVEEIFATRTAEEWDTLLTDTDCCYTRVHTLHDLLHDPHVRDRDALDLNSEGIPFLRSPIRFEHETIQWGRAPGFGEHTIDVLREAGFSDDEIARLATVF